MSFPQKKWWLGGLILLIQISSSSCDCKNTYREDNEFQLNVAEEFELSTTAENTNSETKSHDEFVSSLSCIESDSRLNQESEIVDDVNVGFGLDDDDEVDFIRNQMVTEEDRNRLMNGPLAKPWKDENLIYGNEDHFKRMCNSSGNFYTSNVKQSNFEKQKKYYNIICDELKAQFGPESSQIESYENIIRIAQLYDNNFDNFIIEDKWSLEKKKIITNQDQDILKKLCDINGKRSKNVGTLCELDEIHEKVYQNVKEKLLQNLLEKYSAIAKSQVVDTFVAMFVGWIKHQKNDGTWSKVSCDTPSRRNTSVNYKRMCNPKASFLGGMCFVIQNFLPSVVVMYYYTKNEETYAPLTQGEMANRFCPTPIWTLFNEQSYKTEFRTYYVFKKIFGTILLYFLNGVLQTDETEEWDEFIQNWSNPAIPKLGLIVSRVLNSITYVSILIMTLVLFFIDSTPQDFLLNFLAVEFIQKLDDGVATRHPVYEGISTASGGATILTLEFIASGVRKTDDVENFLSSKVIKVLKYGFEIIIFGMYAYTFICS